MDTSIGNLLCVVVKSLHERGLVDHVKSCSDPDKWHIHDTTITLSLQHKLKSLDQEDLLSLLLELQRMVTHTKVLKESVGDKPFWYPSSEDQAGIRFGLLSAVYLDELTWGDVADIVRGLREWYKEWYKRTGDWLENSFLIYDSERGPLGSGVVSMKKTDGTATA